jgi:hypothetical protein
MTTLEKPSRDKRWPQAAASARAAAALISAGGRISVASHPVIALRHSATRT